LQKREKKIVKKRKIRPSATDMGPGGWSSKLINSRIIFKMIKKYKKSERKESRGKASPPTIS
jgi:hypothetical protein